MNVLQLMVSSRLVLGCSGVILKIVFPFAAIIFLAPISGFDQTLVEDRSVNRLVCSLPQSSISPTVRGRTI